MDADDNGQAFDSELATLRTRVPPQFHELISRLQSAAAHEGGTYSRRVLRLAAQLIERASGGAGADVGNLIDVEAAKSVVFHQPGWTPENVYNAQTLIQVLLAEPPTPSSERLEQLLALSLTPDGSLPAVRDVDPYVVGVSASAYATAGPGTAPYVARQVDGQVRHLLSFEPTVLVVGDAAAGKSRTAFEAALAVMPDAAFLAPVRTPQVLHKLSALDLTRATASRDVLLWLDDLEGYLGPRYRARRGRQRGRGARSL